MPHKPGKTRREYQSKIRARTRVYDRDIYRRRLAMISTMKSAPCSDCGNCFDPDCMDFDHVRGEKKFCIALGLRLSLDRLLAEIEKCDLVCANCHRLRTKKRRRSNG